MKRANFVKKIMLILIAMLLLQSSFASFNFQDRVVMSDHISLQNVKNANSQNGGDHDVHEMVCCDHEAMTHCMSICYFIVTDVMVLFARFQSLSPESPIVEKSIFFTGVETPPPRRIV